MKLRDIAAAVVIVSTVIAAPAMAAGSVRASGTNSVVKSVGARAPVAGRVGAQVDEEAKAASGSWLIAALAAAAVIAGIVVAADGSDKGASN